MIFWIGWEDFRPLTEQKFSETTNSLSLALFYFMEAETIYFYKIIEGTKIGSLLELSEIKNLEGFETEFLRKGIKLLKKPVDKAVFKIIEVE